MLFTYTDYLLVSNDVSIIYKPSVVLAIPLNVNQVESCVLVTKPGNMMRTGRPLLAVQINPSNSLVPYVSNVMGGRNSLVSGGPIR